MTDNGSRSYYAPKSEVTIRRYMRSLYTIPLKIKRGGDLLVIASGGGQELTMTSHFGMKRIDAVEIARPTVTDILENKKDEPGNPYLLPNVYPHTGSYPQSPWKLPQPDESGDGLRGYNRIYLESKGNLTPLLAGERTREISNRGTNLKGGTKWVPPSSPIFL